MASTRTCHICGDSYKYCPHCDGELVEIEPWRFLCCSEACHVIHDVLCQFNFGYIKIDEAQKILQSIDMSSIKIQDAANKRVVDTILNYKKPIENKVINKPNPKLNSKQKNKKNK